jgi:demethylmenaquinone methyltransferase/2-methoxy-6-polyprenyl-1,4-benzoquinol methylase/phosphoethanolamine N-methyltransferase
MMHPKMEPVIIGVVIAHVVIALVGLYFGVSWLIAQMPNHIVIMGAVTAVLVGLYFGVHRLINLHTHTHDSESPAQTEGRLIRWASFYDVSANIMTLGRVRRLRDLTVRNALLQSGENVLDVGCGTGGVTIPAKLHVGKNGRATGIDPSPEMIAVARQKAGRAGLDIDFRVGVIESLPFPDGTFDAVTSSLMMHHLPEHLQVKGLAEIKRVLKPGGRLLIADMMRYNTSFRKRFFTLFAPHLILHQYLRGVKSGIEDMPKLLQEAGFVEIKQLEDHFLTIGFVRATKPAV